MVRSFRDVDLNFLSNYSTYYLLVRSRLPKVVGGRFLVG